MEPIIDATILLRVREIVVESKDVKTFVFELLDGNKLRYQAGQFLTFLIQMHGHEVRRSYSLSTAPDVDEFPAITVKRIDNGEISRFWIDFVHEGDIFTTLAPSGRFVLDETEDKTRDLIMIGAGSGITPLFSLIKQALTVEANSVITLLYANKNEKSTVFMDAIRLWERRFPDRLKVIHIHSEPSDDWSGALRGRINNTRLEQMVSASIRYDRPDVRFFICGPYELMRSVEITLHYLGFGKEQIRKENFVVPVARPVTRSGAPHTIRLKFKNKDYQLYVPEGKTILQAALDEDIHLPYSCKGGVCATCAGVCESGSVFMTINDVLTERDLAQGWVLTCTGYPEDENVIIEIK